MPPLVGLPSPRRAELWDVGGTIYVIYRMGPKGRPMAWRVRNPKELEQLMPITGSVKPHRKLTPVQFRKTGANIWGHSDELRNLEGDPIAEVRQQLKEMFDVMPWLKQPDMMQTHLAAALEGRSPTPQELSRTKWWRSHNAAQRSYLQMHYQDPATAKNLRYSNQRRVRDMLRAAGINNAPDRLQNILANHFTRGDISDVQLEDAIRHFSDPFSKIPLPAPLKKEIAELRKAGKLKKLDVTQEGEDRVAELARAYLGPKYGNWGGDKIARWAGRIRNDPDAELQLTRQLQGQLKALYGAGRDNWDPNTTFDDLAAPWMQLASDTWGEQVMPGDPIVDRLIRLNDATEASTMLLTQGLRRNNQTVVRNTLSDMASSFNLGVRPMI